MRPLRAAQSLDAAMLAPKEEDLSRFKSERRCPASARAPTGTRVAVLTHVVRSAAGQGRGRHPRALRHHQVHEPVGLRAQQRLHWC
jgi:hypothetical protein